MRYKFKHQPYAHQLTALEKSWDKNEYALFCEMGTGKSKILIDNFAMLYDNGQIDGVLVVAPKGVYKNWQRKEVPEHLPEHIVADIVVWSPNHTKKQLEHLDVALKDDDNLKVLIMNVEAFSTDKGVEFAKQFLRKRKVFMAVDESTTIKNRSAKRTKNIVNVGGLAKYRRIATGSPITKTPMDLFSQCDFLDPHLLGFGSFFSFQARYCKMWRRSVGTHSFNQVVGYQNLEELTNNLDRFSYRILKKDCLDLPEKIYIKRLVELTPEQRRVYDQLKTIAPAEWVEGCSRMNLILGSSTHTIEVLKSSKFEKRDQQTNQVVGVIEWKGDTGEVLFEGADVNTYKPVKSTFDLSDIKEDFAYLFVGHWMQGQLGEDRKNVGLLVKKKARKNFLHLMQQEQGFLKNKLKHME